MTLIKLKDILLENVTKEERKERLPGYIEDGAAGGGGSGKAADEAPPSGADIKKYLTTKAKDLAKQFKGNKLFKEYRISSAILASAGDNHEIIIGIKPKQGGEGLIPIKMHVYGKKFITPAGEKTLDDFTGEGQEDSDEDEEITSRGGVATKDFERLSTDDIISQIDNWSKIQGTGAFRDLQKKIASKRI